MPFELSGTAVGCDQHLPLSGMPPRARILQFAKIGGPLLKADGRIWADTLHSLRLNASHIEKGTDAFDVNIFTELEGNF